MEYALGVAVIAVLAIALLLSNRHQQGVRRHQFFLERVHDGLKVIDTLERQLLEGRQSLKDVRDHYPAGVIEGYHYWEVELGHTEDSPWLLQWPGSLENADQELERLRKIGQALSKADRGPFLGDEPQELWDQWRQWHAQIGPVYRAIGLAHDLPEVLKERYGTVRQHWDTTANLISQARVLLEQYESTLLPEFVAKCRQKLDRLERDTQWIASAQPEDNRDWIAANNQVLGTWMSAHTLQRVLAKGAAVDKDGIAFYEHVGVL